MVDRALRLSVEYAFSHPDASRDYVDRTRPYDEYAPAYRYGRESCCSNAPARRTLAGRVLHTPMLPAPKLSALTGADIYVKYENLQVTNSFKERGALNKLASLTPKELR